jgi:NADH dehydrogenase, FAD-containing subunit
MAQKHRIVIVGGGAGGLELATQLGQRIGKKRHIQITLVDATLTHIWKPLLHEIAAGTLNGASEEINYFAHAKKITTNSSSVLYKILIGKIRKLFWHRLFREKSNLPINAELLTTHW